MASRRKAQAAPRPRPVKRQQPSWVPLIATVLVVALAVLGFIFVRWATAPSGPPASSAETSARVVSEITGLPTSELDQAGLGSATNSLQPVPGQALTGPGGKPELLFVGAEYCPYCAAQR